MRWAVLEECRGRSPLGGDVHHGVLDNALPSHVVELPVAAPPPVSHCFAALEPEQVFEGGEASSGHSFHDGGFVGEAPTAHVYDFKNLSLYSWILTLNGVALNDVLFHKLAHSAVATVSLCWMCSCGLPVGVILRPM